MNTLNSLDPDGELVSVHHSTPGSVYMGRRMNRLKLPESPWANPYSLKEFTLEESLKLYKRRLLSNPDLLSQIGTLQGRMGGCFCAGKGDVLGPDNKVRCHIQIISKAGRGDYQAELTADTERKLKDFAKDVDVRILAGPKVNQVGRVVEVDETGVHVAVPGEVANVIRFAPSQIAPELHYGHTPARKSIDHPTTAGQFVFRHHSGVAGGDYPEIGITETTIGEDLTAKVTWLVSWETSNAIDVGNLKVLEPYSLWVLASMRQRFLGEKTLDRDDLCLPVQDPSVGDWVLVLNGRSDFFGAVGLVNFPPNRGWFSVTFCGKNSCKKFRSRELFVVKNPEHYIKQYIPHKIHCDSWSAYTYWKPTNLNVAEAYRDATRELDIGLITTSKCEAVKIADQIQHFSWTPECGRIIRFAKRIYCLPDDPSLGEIMSLPKRLGVSVEISPKEFFNCRHLEIVDGPSSRMKPESAAKLDDIFAKMRKRTSHHRS